MKPKKKTSSKFSIFSVLFVLSALFSAYAEEPMVKNGSLDQVDPADASKPLDWEKPDGLGVTWIDEKGHGKIICLDTSISEQDMVAQWKKQGITDWDIPKPSKGPVAATYGLSFYSISFPIKPDQAYRVSFDFKASKATGGGKLWVRGYAMFRGKLRRRYETYIPCRTKDTEWMHITQCFHPTAHTKDVTEMKIMLYAYWPPGKYYFDNITVVPVSEEEYLKDKKENEINKK